MIAALLQVAALFSFAAFSAGGSAVEPLKVGRATLDCGLRVVAIQLPHRAESTIQLWFHAGSVDDPPDAPGLTAAALHGFSARGEWIAPKWGPRGGELTREVVTDTACGIIIPADRAGFDAQLWQFRAILTAEHRAGRKPTATDNAHWLHALVAGRIDFSAADRVDDEMLVPRLWATGFTGETRSPIAPGDPNSWDRISRQLETEFVLPNATCVLTTPDHPDFAIEDVRDAMRDLPVAAPLRKPWRDRPKWRGGLAPAAIGPIDGVAVAWPTPRFGNVELAVFDVLGQYLTNATDGAIAVGRSPLPTARRAFAGESGVFVLTLPAPCAISGFPAPHPLDTLPYAAAYGAFEALAELCVEPPELVCMERARALAAAHLRTRREDPFFEALDYGLAEVLGGDANLADFEADAIAQATAADLQSLARALLRTPPIIQPLLAERPPRRYVPTSAADDAASRSATFAAAELWTDSRAFHLSTGGAALKLLLKQDQRREAVLRVEWEGAFVPQQLAALRDYTSYHGQLLYPLDGAPSALLVRGTPDRVPALLEFLLRFDPLAATPASVPTIRLLAPLPARDLIASLRAAGVTVDAAER